MGLYIFLVVIYRYNLMSNNPLVENRYQSVLAMNSVARQKGFMNLPTGPAFMSATIGSYLPKGKLYRTDEDIHQAVQLWCRNPAGAENLYGHISKWNTSNVTDMRRLFELCTQFNDDISEWDVSNVRDMGFMFASAPNFNQPIGCWNVSNVTSMDGMFFGARSFDQGIGEWNVSNVTDMSFMFEGAESFDRDISRWNVSKVKEMHRIFDSAVSFNQDISRWDVSNVKNAWNPFLECPILDRYKPRFPRKRRRNSLGGRKHITMRNSRKGRSTNKRTRKSRRRPKI